MRQKIEKMQFFCAFLAVFCIFFCIFCIFGNFSYANAESLTYVVNTTSAVVFKSADLSSEQLQTLSHKTEVQLEESGGTALVYDGTGAGENYTFYHIIGDENISSGYILCDLVSLKTTTITQVPNFNGQTNSSAVVYEYENSGWTATATTLTKGTRIFLYEGFDSSQKYTAISYVLGEEVLYGYLLTSQISPDGVSTTLITCIIVIIAVLGIVFAWLFMKNKKKKINLSKKELKIKNFEQK